MTVTGLEGQRCRQLLLQPHCTGRPETGEVCRDLLALVYPAKKGPRRGQKGMRTQLSYTTT